MPLNQTFLNQLKTAKFKGSDFLVEYDGTKYDKIIANPPFSKNQDIDHVYKMYDALKEGGTLVTITSTHWQRSTNKKESEFRKWLEERDYYMEELEAGTFKESGTNIVTLILKISK